MGTEPTRTCAGCRRRRSRSEMVRVVRLPGGVAIEEPGGWLPGRGAYVCPRERCIDEALGSGRLRRALRSRGPLPEDLPDRLARRIK